MREKRENGLLTSKQAARLLGVSKTTVLRWTDDGILRVIRLPSGHRRYQYAEINRQREQMGYEEPVPEPGSCQRERMGFDDVSHKEQGGA